MSDVKRYVAFVGADGNFAEHHDLEKRVYGGRHVVLASDHDAAISALTTRCEALEQAVRQSMIAIDDWLNDYADDLCDPQRVAEARGRINGRGTIGYIGSVQAINRAALADPGCQS